MTNPATPADPQPPQGSSQPQDTQNQQQIPPPFGQQVRPNPVSGTAPGPRSGAVVLGAVAMFGVGVIYLLFAGFVAWNIVRFSLDQDIGVFVNLGFHLLFMLGGFSAGALVLAGKQIGRMLGFITAGAAFYSTCQGMIYLGTSFIEYDRNFDFMAAANGFLMFGGLLLSIVGIVALGTRGATKWFAAKAVAPSPTAYPPPGSGGWGQPPA